MNIDCWRTIQLPKPFIADITFFFKWLLINQTQYNLDSSTDECQLSCTVQSVANAGPLSSLVIALYYSNTTYFQGVFRNMNLRFQTWGVLQLTLHSSNYSIKQDCRVQICYNICNFCVCDIRVLSWSAQLDLVLKLTSIRYITRKRKPKQILKYKFTYNILWNYGQIKMK